MILSPYLNSFVDELEKLALAGAVVGGYLGSKLPGNKLVTTAAGALAGHGVQGALRVGKRHFVDELEHREREALYNYRPSYGLDNQMGARF